MEKGIILKANVNGKEEHFSFPDRSSFFEAVENGLIPDVFTYANVFGKTLPDRVYRDGLNFLDVLIRRFFSEKALDNQEVPIFFDMDGTLAEWETAAHIDEVMAPGYFQHRRPMGSMIQAAKKLMDMGHPVYITSKVISGTTAVEDKNIWLDRHFPQIKKENRFFIPYENKDKNAIPLEGGVRPYYVLIDDSTHYGLHGWNGIGIKVDNGINNTNRSWRGYLVSSQSYPEVIAATINTIAVLEANRKRTSTLVEKIFRGMHSGLVSIVFGNEKENDSKALVCCKIGETVFPFTDVPYTDMDKFYDDYSCTRTAGEIARVLKTPSENLDENLRKECLRELGCSGEE